MSTEIQILYTTFAPHFSYKDCPLAPPAGDSEHWLITTSSLHHSTPPQFSGYPIYHEFSMQSLYGGLSAVLDLLLKPCFSISRYFCVCYKGGLCDLSKEICPREPAPGEMGCPVLLQPNPKLAHMASAASNATLEQAGGPSWGTGILVSNNPACSMGLLGSPSAV